VNLIDTLLKGIFPPKDAPWPSLLRQWLQ